MFDDSKSFLSELNFSHKPRRPSSQVSQTSINKPLANNNIEERIEKMFKEIAMTTNWYRSDQMSGQRHMENSQMHSCLSEKQCFNVTYIGSQPLHDKNVSLLSLQYPLKEIYFTHKRNPSKDQSNLLTISKEGLKIKTLEKEDLHPFSTIAVWASVKLTLRRSFKGTEYAFLPLVNDPEGTDKNILFKNLIENDELSHSLQEENKNGGQSPIFAVVMKNINKNKQLECHGFVCKSSEEAIQLAAKLYEALMKRLKRKKDHKIQKVENERQENTVTVPLKSNENNFNTKASIPEVSPEVTLKVPQRPDPPKIENDENSSNLANLAPTSIRKKTKIKNNENPINCDIPQETVRENENSCEGDSRYVEEMEAYPSLKLNVPNRSDNVIVRDSRIDGDILTKVTIPRSRSFLNANGPLSRFPRVCKTTSNNEITSPLGFREIFNELQLNEGLENMDDILDVIIDAEGMSFNDLKPIYKEFLLKLALTLTKDELYQRSKIIMRRQKKRSKRCTFRKHKLLPKIGINRIFTKTVSKLRKSRKSRSTSLEFTSIVFQSTNKRYSSSTKKRKTQSFKVKRSHKRLTKFSKKHKSITSKMNRFFQPKLNFGRNISSSGYFSCSDCSYDSDSCHCSSPDKCYCSLKIRNNKYDLESGTGLDKSNFETSLEPSEPCPEDSIKSCSCDTESCNYSGKCYCDSHDENFLNSTIRSPTFAESCSNSQSEKKVKLNKSCHNHQKTSKNVQEFVHGRPPRLPKSKKPHHHLSNFMSNSNDKLFGQKSYSHTIKDADLMGIQKKLQQLFDDSSKNYREDSFKEYFFKELQNTMPVSKAYDSTKKVQKMRCSTNGIESLVDNGFSSDASVFSGKKRPNSLRCRNEILENRTKTHHINRSVSHKTNPFSGSLPSNKNCDFDISHIKFPGTGFMNNSLRFTKRMDVYNSFSEKDLREQNISNYYPKHKEKKIQEIEKIVPHSILDNECRRSSKGSGHIPFSPSSENINFASNITKKKVLIVSARDPKGKVVYMSTSNKSDSHFKNSTENVEKIPNEALAVKKSAEIAALFSEATNQRKMNESNTFRHNSFSRRPHRHTYRSTNLESSLGYLP